MKNKIQKLLNKSELSIIKKLSTPARVQDFLDRTPFNFEQKGETYMSPRRVLNVQRMHCFEGALFATLCLTYHGFSNFLVDLKVKASAKEDSDHTLCVFKINGFWGAISKTNHSVLRWRDPIYASIRELAMSYFHEYFLNDGRKTLQSYSKPFSIWKKFGVGWVTAKENLDEVAVVLDKSKHMDFVPLKNRKFIRKAGKTEIKGAAVAEWNVKVKNAKI